MSHTRKSSKGVSGAVAIFTILASAVVVLSGLIAVTRALFRLGYDIRENKAATQANTKVISDLSDNIPVLDGRMTTLENRVSTMEARVSILERIRKRWRG